jgi:hypothetical protein
VQSRARVVALLGAGVVKSAAGWDPARVLRAAMLAALVLGSVVTLLRGGIGH